MGSFETYVFDGDEWSEVPSGTTWLSISIHDSDFATVEFESAGGHPGLFYLGFQPRDYFEDASASGDVDIPAQARALAQWVNEVRGESIAPKQIAPLFAIDNVTEPDDVFVEETVVRLLSALRLPVPADLQSR